MAPESVGPAGPTSQRFPILGRGPVTHFAPKCRVCRHTGALSTFPQETDPVMRILRSLNDHMCMLLARVYRPVAQFLGKSLSDFNLGGEGPAYKSHWTPKSATVRGGRPGENLAILRIGGLSGDLQRDGQRNEANRLAASSFSQRRRSGSFCPPRLLTTAKLKQIAMADHERVEPRFE